jgi:hypothetical protein
MFSSSDVEQILEVGGSVRIPRLALETLIRLAEVAKISGGRLEIEAHDLAPEAMLKIAKAGRAHVAFDLTARNDREA